MDKKQVYCRYCGKLIDEDAPFCTYCGKPQGDMRQGILGIKRKAIQYMEFLASVILSILGVLFLPFKKLVNIHFSNAQKDKFRRVKVHIKSVGEKNEESLLVISYFPHFG